MIKRSVYLRPSGPRLSRQTFLRGGAAGLATAGMASLIGAFGLGGRVVRAQSQGAGGPASAAPIVTDVGITTTIGDNGARVVHVGAVTNDGGLLYTQATAGKDSSMIGPWTPFIDVKAFANSNPGDIVDVDLATGADGVQVVVATSDGGVWHTVRFGNGNWQVFGNVKGATGTDPGPVVVVTAAEVAVSDTHVGVVTANGGLFHAIRHSNGDWTRFGDVKRQAGNPGDIIDADFAAPGLDLHVAALTRNGGIWHTIRVGTFFRLFWTRFNSVLREAGQLSSVGAVTAGGHPFRLDVGAVRDFDGHLFHTVREAAGSWTRWEDVSVLADLANIVEADFALDHRGYLNAVVVAGDGSLWYSNQHAGRWLAFAEVG